MAGTGMPLRVIFITGMHPTAASPNRGVIIRRLAEALRGRGHDIELLDVGGDRGTVRYVAARERVRRAVRGRAPDLLHVHFGYSVLAVPRVSVPIVASFYGDDLNGMPVDAERISLKSRIGTLA